MIDINDITFRMEANSCKSIVRYICIAETTEQVFWCLSTNSLLAMICCMHTSMYLHRNSLSGRSTCNSNRILDKQGNVWYHLSPLHSSNITTINSAVVMLDRLFCHRVVLRIVSYGGGSNTILISYTTRNILLNTLFCGLASTTLLIA